jgi:hypothetical protein
VNVPLSPKVRHRDAEPQKFKMPFPLLFASGLYRVDASLSDRVMPSLLGGTLFKRDLEDTKLRFRPQLAMNPSTNIAQMWPKDNSSGTAPVQISPEMDCDEKRKQTFSRPRQLIHYDKFMPTGSLPMV